MFNPDDIISYDEMCAEEGAKLQHGMNFKLRGGHSVILMSVRPNAPYADRIEENGEVLIYEGHDIPEVKGGPDPKKTDQQMHLDSGKLTRNGHFFEAAKKAASGLHPELVRVYEKIKKGIWVFAGHFHLIDAWTEIIDGRKVFKFRLKITDEISEGPAVSQALVHDRMIPPKVKIAVWKRDQGKCVKCGSTTNLHFDHILPFSKGGTSLLENNIQLLCAKHNLAKRAKIE